MTVERYIPIIASLFILASLALGVEGSPLFVNKWALAFTAFVGANLFQFGFTNVCPLGFILKKLGVPGGSVAWKKRSMRHITIPSFRQRMVALGLTLGLAAGAQAAILDSSVALDAVYIPALSLTNAKPGDTAAADKARAAMQRLDARWPEMRASLLQDLSSGTPAQVAVARNTMAQVDGAIAASRKAIAANDFAATHTALEDVRTDLMKLRQARGVDYFMDRLTAFHQPMEVLALAGNSLKTQDLTPAKRAEMEKTFAEASALWRSVEQHLPNPQAYQLNAARLAQFNKGMADVTASLSRLSDSLRGTDNSALLKTAAAIRPPFARTFTAFGHYD